MTTEPDIDRKRRAWRSLDLIHDGRTFLRRRGLDSFDRVGIFLHRIDGPDPGKDPHDHPWPFVTLILRGGYSEVVADTRRAATSITTRRTWRRWSIHRMPLTVAHRIVAVEPGTISLVVRGRKSRRWGFYQPRIIDERTGRTVSLPCWVDWQDYDYASRRPIRVDSDRPEEVR